MDVVEMARAPQHLPDDLLQDVLLRLPPRSVARCLAVCKDWRSLVSAPAFRRAHADRPADVAEVTVSASYFLGDGARKVVLFGLFRGSWSRRNVHDTPLDLALPLPNAPATMVLGSWDGVLCVERGAPPLRNLRWRLFSWPDDFGGLRDYVLRNPSSKACATVSPPPGRGVIIGAYAHQATMRFHLLHAAGEAACLVDPDLFVPTAFRLQRVGDGGPGTRFPCWNRKTDTQMHS